MAVETVSRVYEDACVRRPKTYYDYSEYKIDHGDIERYRICKYVGKGKYSQVFEGRIVPGPGEPLSRCIIKILKPVRVKKVYREIMILKRLLGVERVVQLLDVVRDPGSGATSLVFEYEEHEDTRTLFGRLSLSDVRYYSREILEALDFCHSKGIMHRDIKPQNLIINHKKRRIKIIDWGLADFYIPKFPYNVGVASTHFKAPELLVNYRTYDYGLDTWAFGCVFAEMVFSKGPFFSGNCNENQLVQIVQCLGSARFMEYLETYKITVRADLLGRLRKFPGKTWASILLSRDCLLARHERRIHRELCLPMDVFSPECEETFGVLSSLLVFDHMKRSTARECLDLPFFRQAK